MTNIAAVSFDFSFITSTNIMVAILGYVIVFLALVLLYTVFYNLPKVIHVFSNVGKRRRDRKVRERENLQSSQTISGEVNAAVAMAIYMHFNEYHDDESNIVTIKRVSKTYSPWSSKIYSVRNAFNRI